VHAARPDSVPERPLGISNDAYANVTLPLTQPQAAGPIGNDDEQGHQAEHTDCGISSVVPCRIGSTVPANADCGVSIDFRGAALAAGRLLQGHKIGSEKRASVRRCPTNRIGSHLMATYKARSPREFFCPWRLGRKTGN
jgi:hypothetical protein